MKLVETLKENRIVKEILAVTDRIGQRKVAANAAGLSFYLFLSMIPLLILLCSLLPLTGITAEELVRSVAGLAPEALSPLLGSLIREAYAARVSVFSLSCVFLLWAATKLTKALILSLNAIYGQEEKRSFVGLTLRSLAFTAGMVLLLGTLLLLIVRRHTAEELVAGLFGALRLPGVWTSLGNRLAMIAVGAPVFALIYTVAPYGKRKYLRQLPGALAASTAATVFSLIFSVYSTGSNIYHSFYGSLTAVALLLFFVYICFRIFLVGAVLNAHLAERGSTDAEE
ncbi:MAG: YihY/virulence factor BrkB family protein [Clostridia bacterium]|nr:YihY/virulence factor BrkB family protein [Clostridia bacterium]